MSQPVKLSDALVLDARLTAETAQRSIAGQIEFWAKLGRAVEPLLLGVQAMSLTRSGAARPISECLESADSAKGRKRVAEHLKTLPYPHYEPSETPGLIIRTTADGKRSTGRFVNRQFKVVKASKR